MAAAITSALESSRTRDAVQAQDQPTALVLYHYLYPDEVVSSIHVTELCTGLSERGWRVIGSACNRGYENAARRYPRRSVWNEVNFLRVWRPGLRQSSSIGRLANAIWMICAWSLLALDLRIRPDVIIVGTDPI